MELLRAEQTVLNGLDPTTTFVSVLDSNRLNRPGALHIDRLMSLEELVGWLRDSECPLATSTGTIRISLRSGGRSSGSEYERLKTRLPSCIPAMDAPAGTPVQGASAEYHNGLFGFDIDEERESLDLTAIRRDLTTAPGCVLVATSAGGDGLFCFFAGPRASSAKEYSQLWQRLSQEALPASARIASGAQSKNLNRFRFLAHDPIAWLAPGPVVPVALPNREDHHTANFSDDTDGYREALGSITPPEDYGQWLGWLHTLKALGVPAQEAETWSSAGAKYVPGEVLKRWEGLQPEESPEQAYNQLMGAAYNNGWRRPPAATRVTSPVSGEDQSSLESDVYPWQLIGDHCAGFLRDKFRFDAERRTWWKWADGNHWRVVLDDTEITDTLNQGRFRLSAELKESAVAEVSDKMADSRDWERHVSAMRGEFWTRLRTGIARPMPAAPQWEFAVANGVVDLRTGEITPPDPAVHDTTAVARGAYRLPDQHQLRELLWARLHLNLDAEDFNQLIKCLGVGVARRSTDYTSLIWLYGEPGTGKSTTLQLLRNAFGRQSMGVSARILLGKDRSEIEADLTDLLEADPAFILISEASKASPARLLAMTGGDALSARRPHMRTPIRRALSGAMVCASVTAPSMPADTGLRRRLAVIHFPHQLPESVPRTRNFSSDELDAVVTLAVLEAIEVGKANWEAPSGNAAAKAAFIAEADAVVAWLDDLDVSMSGKSVSEFADAFSAEHPHQAKISAGWMGRSIKNSSKWRVEMVTRQRRRIRIVTLRSRNGGE